VVAERSVGNPPQEPYVGNQDWARHARSEAASSVSDNQCLPDDNNAWRRITQNRNMWEYNCDRDDLRNIIDDRRRIRARTPTPP
jgi:hypothetical protein